MSIRVASIRSMSANVIVHTSLTVCICALVNTDWRIYLSAGVSVYMFVSTSLSPDL